VVGVVGLGDQPAAGERDPRILVVEADERLVLGALPALEQEPGIRPAHVVRTHPTRRHIIQNPDIEFVQELDEVGVGT
jgi:hypothetical protein